MKKTFLTSFLIGTLLTSSVSWSYRPDWSQTIPGTITTSIGLGLLYLVVNQPRGALIALSEAIRDEKELFGSSLLLIPTGLYSLYKGLIANRSSSQQDTTKGPLLQ